MNPFKFRRSNASVQGGVGAAVSAMMFLLPGAASAFCIYNQTGGSANARVSQGNFSANIGGGGGNACCHWSDKSCNPSGSQDAMLSAQIEMGSFNCVVSLQAGGYAQIEQEDRSALGVGPNYFCNSYDKNHQRVSSANTYGLGATTRDVRFLATADPQYDNGSPNAEANQTLSTMVNQLRSSGQQVRGILIAGDLTQNTRTKDEFSWYKNALSGYSRFVYDGLGNHDVVEPTIWQKAACDFGDSACVDPGALRADIADRKRSTVKTFGMGPHYSWDWQDVHFVQLNLYPGNGTVAEQFSQSSPDNSLAFLQLDLAMFVGASGRPVVLMHHYGFDSFSIGEDGEQWWTEAQRTAYWDAIAAYNVVGIFTGHKHLAASENYKVPFHRPANRVSGPEFIPTFVSGAAKNGAYLDAQFTQDALQVTRRDQNGTAQPGLARYGLRANLALRKPASQASTAYGGDAARAVDGRLDGAFNNGSVTHTSDSGVQPWWQVDLQSAQRVGEVVLHNRSDCCSDRLSNFSVLVSENGASWTTAVVHPGTAGGYVTLPVNRVARYVKVQLNGAGVLSLAEVQVFPQRNLAAGKTAWQSSTYHSGGGAMLAVDGSRDGNYFNGSVSHTAESGDVRPWWQVDLRSVRAVGDVVVYNRTDCCSARLGNFTVEVSDDDKTWTVAATHSGTVGTQATIAVNRNARFVRLQMQDATPLSLAEVEVFARP